MTKPARARRDRARSVAGRQHEDVEELIRRSAGRPGRREEPDDEAVTVQLLPHHLMAGSLPAFRVGEDVEVAPAIYAVGHLPAVSGRDRWAVDEFGCFDARGTIVAAPLDPHGCECVVDVLDVAGRLFPLNWAGSGPTTGRIWVEGALYWAPELAAGTAHGDAVALCRQRFRVREVRRYAHSALGPRAPVRLDGVPDPDEVDDDALHVADLHLLEDTHGLRAPEPGTRDR